MRWPPKKIAFFRNAVKNIPSTHQLITRNGSRAMKIIESKRTVLVALTLFNLVAGQRSAFAVLSTWSGGGVSGAWSLTANWSGGTLPAATNDVFFPATAGLKANDDNLLTSIRSITFGVSG